MPDHRDTVVLLGAGASQEAGVPTTFEMTRHLVERISDVRPDHDSVVSALNFVCGALMAHDAATLGQSPYAGLDVERVFAAVELLAERSTLEVTPFVAAWHPAVDTWDTRDRSAPPFSDRNLQEAILGSPSMGGATKLITDLIDARTGSAADGATYRKLASLMLSQLRELVATTKKDVGYLAPLARAARESRMTIATLNYDLSIEQIAKMVGVSWSTGVNDWLRTGRWRWPDDGIRLLKLHGSINWVWVELEERSGHLPQQVIDVADEQEDVQGQPAVVFGQRGKLRAKGPFLGLLGELESLMSEARHLVVVGYSFRDEHVNELIQRWTSEDSSRTMTVVDPGWPERFPPGFPRDFRAGLDRYLTPPDIRGNEFQPRLEVVRKVCSAAVRELF